MLRNRDPNVKAVYRAVPLDSVLNAPGAHLDGVTRVRSSIHRRHLE